MNVVMNIFKIPESGLLVFSEKSLMHWGNSLCITLRLHPIERVMLKLFSVFLWPFLLVLDRGITVDWFMNREANFTEICAVLLEKLSSLWADDTRSLL